MELFVITLSITIHPINNTSYNEYSADGIYVDGGKEIIIEQNQSYENHLGIEVASEHAGKSASQITVRDNTISNNIMSGIAIGGYDSQQDMPRITRLQIILFIKMTQKIKKVAKSN